MLCQVIVHQELVMFLYFIWNFIFFSFPQFQCQLFNMLMTSVALASLVTMHLLNNFLLCVHFYIVIENLSSFYRLLMKFRSYRK